MKTFFLPDSAARRRILTYSDLFEANRKYEKNEWAFDSDWLLAKKFVDWKNLSSLPREEIMSKVVKFLNRWKNHIPKNWSVVDSIIESHKDSKLFIDLTRYECLWDLVPEKVIYLDEKSIPVIYVIFLIFNRFRDIGFHLRETAASKLLHHINPNLFIMWDDKIAKAYKVEKTARGYAYEFMPIMKEKANQVIDSYMKEFGVPRYESINKLNSHRPHKTLVKLLDEYNWINYRSLTK